MLKVFMRARILAKLNFAALLFALAISSPARADDNLPDLSKAKPLTAAQLEAVFRGKTHRGSYNFIRKNFTSYGFEETTFADGTLEHIQSKKNEAGVWEINTSDDLICYLYIHSPSRHICFSIYQLGNCYYHYQRSVAGRPVKGFTARSVIKGEVPDCAPLTS